MPATVTEARDQMSALFKTAWEAGFSPDLTVIWDDIGEPEPTSRDPWARFVVRHWEGEQGSLANHDGQRRYCRRGTIFVNLFAPTGEGLSRLDQMAIVAMNAFEGATTSGGVWFRNVRLRERGVDGNWQMATVMVDFEYDEVR